jgi:hypothetical protein
MEEEACRVPSQAAMPPRRRVWIPSSAGVCVMRLEDIALAVVLMAALLLSLWLVKDA